MSALMSPPRTSNVVTAPTTVVTEKEQAFARFPRLGVNKAVSSPADEANVVVRRLIESGSLLDLLKDRVEEPCWQYTIAGWIKEYRSASQPS